MKILTTFKDGNRNYLIEDITKSSDEFLINNGFSLENSFVYNLLESTKRGDIKVGRIVGSKQVYADGTTHTTFCMCNEDRELNHKLALISAKKYLEENC